MNDNSQHIIYGLIDPNNGQLRYIGYTSDKIKRYSAHHAINRLSKNTHKNNWIKLLLRNNQKSEIIILEKYETADELPQAEIDLIEYYKYIGADLTNATSGGEGLGTNISLETRLKMSLAKKGKPSPNKGKKYSEDFCKEMSRVRIGHVCSDEQKLKVSKIMKQILPEEEEQIRALYAAGGTSQRKLAKQFNHNRETIKSILTKKVRKRKRKSKSRFTHETISIC